MEAGIAGQPRGKMVEVVIASACGWRPINVTAGRTDQTVVQNNQHWLIAAGEIESAQGTFSVKGSLVLFRPRDIYNCRNDAIGTRVGDNS